MAGDDMKYSKKNGILLIIALFVAVAAALLVHHYTNAFTVAMSIIPPCSFNEITRLFCPGCGITRSIRSLIEGDILLSLRYNPLPIVFGILLFALYLELVLKCFGKDKKLLPRKLWVYIILIFVLLAYMVARNFFVNLTPIYTDVFLN